VVYFILFHPNSNELVESVQYVWKRCCEKGGGELNNCVSCFFE